MLLVLLKMRDGCQDFLIDTVTLLFCCDEFRLKIADGPLVHNCGDGELVCLAARASLKLLVLL